MVLQKENPAELIYDFFCYFNLADESSLNRCFDSPWFLMTNSNTQVFQSYGDAINFNFLRETGWHHSKINELKLIYQDPETALITFNFSRMSAKNQEIYNADATHLLVSKTNSWKIKCVTIRGEMSLK